MLLCRDKLRWDVIVGVVWRKLPKNIKGLVF